MKYELSFKSNCGEVSYEGKSISLLVKEATDDGRFSMTFSFTEWEDDAYVFMPACVYDGNRRRKYLGTYPPMYTEEDLRVDNPPIITDIPSLGENGDETVEVTSADMSVPCFGMFYKKKKQAIFIFTEQACKGKNIGYFVKSGALTLQFPAVRTRVYTMCNTNSPSSDTGVSVFAGELINSKVVIKEFDCESIPRFLELFFNNRRSLLSDPAAPNGYTEELWKISEEHMNRDNFNGEYFAEMSKKWQCGWVGGGMSTLALYRHGDETTRERVIKTLDFMTRNAAKSGLFYTKIVDGRCEDDGGGKEHMRGAALIRKDADALYHLFRHFDFIEPKKAWVDAARACADAFVRLYEKYEDFGHFVNVETGDIMVGGTTSGAAAIGALARAYAYFKDEKYLKVALASGEKYYQSFVKNGYTYGGPREALCAPDSESAYAMVESMVVLYELTKDPKWLEYAKDSLHLMSSWVMCYSFKFPENSEFARLKINTVGSVFANAQNKHSSPGIATASGDAFYKLYKYTGNEDYLTLLRDVAFFIPQCVSREDRIIYAWDGRPLGSGWVNERVNTSDWQGAGSVGGVFCFSCWCESALLLSFNDLIYNKEISKLL